MTYEDLYETGPFDFIDNIKNFELEKSDATLISDPYIAWKRFVDRMSPVDLNQIFTEKDQKEAYDITIELLKKSSGIDDQMIVDMTNKQTTLDAASNFGMSILNLMITRGNETAELLSLASHKIGIYLSLLNMKGSLSNKAKASLSDTINSEPKIYLVVERIKNDLFFDRLVKLFDERRISGGISTSGRSAYIKIAPYTNFEPLKALCSIVTESY